jgi:hypothetical protein
VSPASRAEITAYVEKKAAGTLRTQRALLSAIDAPSGRISEPPGGASSDDLEEQTMVFRPDHHLLHLGTPRKHGSQTPAPLDVLRQRLTNALEHDRPRISEWTMRFYAPLRVSARRFGSNALAAGAAVLLLLAAVKLSRGTPTVAPAASPLPAAAEPVRAAKESTPAARRVAAATMDFTPPDAWAQLEDTRPAPEPAPAAASAPERSERPRAKAVIRRAPAAAPADRGSCDPPFTLDANGIKRLKVRCL